MNSYNVEQDVKYQFTESSEGIALSYIELLKDKKVLMEFKPAFLINNKVGDFSIYPPKEIGYIGGSYKVVEKDNVVEIYLTPNEGWTSVPTSRISKLILSAKSVFCTWCKQYEYSAVLDLREMKVKSKWVNGNKK